METLTVGATTPLTQGTCVAIGDGTENAVCLVAFDCFENAPTCTAGLCATTCTDVDCNRFTHLPICVTSGMETLTVGATTPLTQGTCVAIGDGTEDAVCLVAFDCSESAPVCTSGLCAKTCSTDRDCNRFSDSPICVTGTMATNVPALFPLSGSCVSIGSGAAGDICGEEDDCSYLAPVCTADRVCATCLMDVECNRFTHSPVCVTAAIATNGLPSPLTQGTCVGVGSGLLNTVCVEDTDCLQDAPVCSMTRLCADASTTGGCTDNDGCNRFTHFPICSAGQCVAAGASTGCSVDVECPSTAPVCTGTCGNCVNNTDCNRFTHAPLCVTTFLNNEDPTLALGSCIAVGPIDSNTSFTCVRVEDCPATFPICGSNFLCLLGCSQNSDCDRFSSTSTCDVKSTSLTYQQCIAVMSGTGDVGDPCSSATDCSALAPICTPVATGSVCQATCTANWQCDRFGTTPVCQGQKCVSIGTGGLGAACIQGN